MSGFSVTLAGGENFSLFTIRRCFLFLSYSNIDSRHPLYGAVILKRPLIRERSEPTAKFAIIFCSKEDNPLIDGVCNTEPVHARKYGIHFSTEA